VARIDQWLRQAANRLKDADIPSHRLDAELILANTLTQNRPYLHAHGEQHLTDKQLKVADTCLQQRLKRMPLAYVLGYKEFYGRNFVVTTDVLIPRPETEALIELLLELSPKPGGTLIDVGAGSGAIAVTAKLEMPHLRVCATDVSAKALVIARKNAKLLHASVTFTQKDLLDNAANGPFDFIVANLPYVADDWDRSPETAFEPPQALFANDEGLALIKKLLAQAIHHLAVLGYVLLECDPRQHSTIINFAQHHGYKLVKKQDFCIVLRR
jgi:release factor glutamine methyltransferase